MKSSINCETLRKECARTRPLTEGPQECPGVTPTLEPGRWG